MLVVTYSCVDLPLVRLDHRRPPGASKATDPRPSTSALPTPAIASSSTRLPTSSPRLSPAHGHAMSLPFTPAASQRVGSKPSQAFTPSIGEKRSREQSSNSTPRPLKRKRISNHDPSDVVDLTVLGFRPPIRGEEEVIDLTNDSDDEPKGVIELRHTPAQLIASTVENRPPRPPDRPTISTKGESAVPPPTPAPPAPPKQALSVTPQLAARVEAAPPPSPNPSSDSSPMPRSIWERGVKHSINSCLSLVIKTASRNRVTSKRKVRKGDGLQPTSSIVEGVVSTPARTMGDSHFQVSFLFDLLSVLMTSQRCSVNPEYAIRRCEGSEWYRRPFLKRNVLSVLLGLACEEYPQVERLAQRRRLHHLVGDRHNTSTNGLSLSLANVYQSVRSEKYCGKTGLDGLYLVRHEEEIHLTTS